jgi:hypothetical protein
MSRSGRICQLLCFPRITACCFTHNTTAAMLLCTPCGTGLPRGLHGVHLCLHCRACSAALAATCAAGSGRLRVSLACWNTSRHCQARCLGRPAAGQCAVGLHSSQIASCLGAAHVLQLRDASLQTECNTAVLCCGTYRQVLSAAARMHQAGADNTRLLALGTASPSSATVSNACACNLIHTCTTGCRKRRYSLSVYTS